MPKAFKRKDHTPNGSVNTGVNVAVHLMKNPLQASLRKAYCGVSVGVNWTPFISDVTCKKCLGRLVKRTAKGLITVNKQN